MFVSLVIVLALLLGYVVTVLTAMLGTLAISMSFPAFAVADHRIRNSYKWAHELLWFLCCFTGGFVTAAVGKEFDPFVTELGLAATLIYVLWSNSWEAKQRGIAHQIVITLVTVIGVLCGYFLEFRIS